MPQVCRDAGVACELEDGVVRFDPNGAQQADSTLLALLASTLILLANY